MSTFRFYLCNAQEGLHYEARDIQSRSIGTRAHLDLYRQLS